MAESAPRRRQQQQQQMFDDIDLLIVTRTPLCSLPFLVRLREVKSIMSDGHERGGKEGGRGKEGENPASAIITSFCVDHNEVDRSSLVIPARGRLSERICCANITEWAQRKLGSEEENYRKQQPPRWEGMMSKKGGYDENVADLRFCETNTELNGFDGNLLTT